MPLKFNLSHLTLIALLSRRTSPHTVTRLTALVGCSIQTMYRLTRKLEEAGLIAEREPSPDKLPEDKTRPHRVFLLTRDGKYYARMYREEQLREKRNNRRRRSK